MADNQWEGNKPVAPKKCIEIHLSPVRSWSKKENDD